MPAGEEMVRACSTAAGARRGQKDTQRAGYIDTVTS